MLSTEFGRLIRRERLARGLKQADLASAAGVSRTVVSKLEQGKPGPVQTDVLDRLLSALGVQPGVVTNPQIEARRIARLEQRARLDRQRARHLRLAVELAADRRRAPRLIARAAAVVALWRKQGSCSPFYIDAWSRLLALPPAELARQLSDLGEWEDALLQNTPWSWAWN